MFKTNITYTDMQGVSSTETLHFNLTTVEIARLGAKISPDGGDLAAHFQKVASSGNALNTILLMTEVVLAAYGVPTPDGRGFQKSPALVQAFEYSFAFAELIEKLMVDEQLAVDFGNNVLAINPDIVKAAETAQLKVPAPDHKSASNVLQMSGNVGNTPIVAPTASDLSESINNILNNTNIPADMKGPLIAQLTKG